MQAPTGVFPPNKSIRVRWRNGNWQEKYRATCSYMLFNYFQTPVFLVQLISHKNKAPRCGIESSSPLASWDKSFTFRLARPS